MVLGDVFVPLIGATLFVACCRYRRNKKYPLSGEDLQHYFDEQFLRHEERVRRNWRLSFFCAFGMSLLVVPLACVICPGELGSNMAVVTEPDNLFAMIVGLIWLFLSSLIFYHCAYRRRGTIWLFLFVILFPTRVIIEFGMRCLHPTPTLFRDLIILFIDNVIPFWFFVNCMRLRRVNAFRKAQIKLARKNKYFQKETVPAT
jgi:hypothetical protein